MVIGLSVVAPAIGYLVAAGSALWLEPTHGWRVLRLIGAPTGLLLVVLTFLLPQAPPATATPTVTSGGTHHIHHPPAMALRGARSAC